MTRPKNKRQYNCTICKKECLSRDKRSHLCGSVDCLNAFGCLNYSQKLYKKTCKHCNKEFEGKYRETNCLECKDIIESYLVEKETNICCERCNDPYGKRILKCTKNETPKDLISGVCDQCKEKTNKIRSESKTGDKNPNWIGGPKFHKRQSKGLTKEELAEQASERMRLNNPMKNPETRDRVSNAIKNVIYKKGRDHRNWKGNRNRAQTIRSRLYKTWIFPILERDKFTCQDCGKNKCRLEVHHTKEPFRTILDKILQGKILSDISYEEFEIISQDVIKYHVEGPVEGITYCKPCHKKHDPLRK